MERHELPESHWLKLEPLLPGRPGGHGGVARDNRNFLNAVWHLSKTGTAWRDLPERFGKWDTVYHRFNQWCKKGVWQRLFKAVSRDADMEWLMMDSTVIRARPHAAGMNDETDDQALGRSRGGFGTKIHLAVDALGNPPGDSHAQSGAGRGHLPRFGVADRPSAGESLGGQGI